MGVELQPRKFRTFFVGNEPSQNPAVPKLIAIGKELGKEGLLDGHGSLSTRYGKRIVINTAAASLAALAPADFVEIVDYDAQRHRLLCLGRQEPCFEAGLHWLLYNTHEEIHAVLHFDDPVIAKAQETARIFPETRELRTPGTLEWTMDAIKIVRKAPFFILKQHGSFAVGASIEGARDLALEAHGAAREELGG